jgi:hypothetical protein
MAYRTIKGRNARRSRPNSNLKKKKAVSKEPEYAESNYITPEEARALSRSRITKNKNGHPDECICTICSCGAHKCPPDRMQGRYHNLKSSYMQDFTGEYQAPTRADKRQHYVHKPRPFDGVTTNQSDYKGWGPQAVRKPCKLADNGLGSQGLPFEGSTTSQHDYRRWNARPAEPTIKQNSRANILPDDRDWKTEFSGQFLPKGGAKRRSRAPVDRRTSSLPFEGISTSQADFKGWKLEPNKAYQTTQAYKPRPDDRDFLTEGRSEYTEKPFDYCPAVEVFVTSKPNNGHVLVEKQGEHWTLRDHPRDWDRTQLQQQSQAQGVFA